MLSTLFVIFFVVATHRVKCDHSTSELNIKHLKHHEMVYFNRTDTFTSTNIMEFDAFNQHYVIQLDLVEHLIPNNIIQHHPPGHNEIEPYYTSLTKSCHYHGRVLNTHDDNAYAVLSFCPKRGIRGEVQAFGDKIYIKPTASYTKPFRFSDLNDEHLIYRASDEIIDAVNDKGRIGHSSSFPNNAPSINSSRRRLYNNGKQTIEVLVINGAARTKWYKDNKGSSWKQELNSDFGDLFSKINRPYNKASWDSDIGSVSVKFAQLDILTDYGDVGRPKGSSSSSYKKPCGSEADILEAKCSVSEDNYLNKIENYIRKFDDYDTAALVDLVPFHFEDQGNSFSATLGLACVGCMCTSSASSVNFDATLHGGDANIGPNWGSDTTAATIAHEIGHNFNMDHDEDDNSCSARYLMGDGDLSDGFSSCSRNEVLKGFKSDGYSCLSGGGGNDGGGNNYDPPNDDDDDDQPSSCNGDSCVRLGNIVDTQHNGAWEAMSNPRCSNGYKVYGKSALFLCYDGDKWIITSKACSDSSNDIYAYCTKDTSSISSCTSWKVWVYNGDWDLKTDNDVCVTGCSDSCGSNNNDDDDDAYDNNNNNNNDNSGSCSGSSCVDISGMKADSNGKRYNGEWIKSGCDNDGNPYYKSSKFSNRYLCYNGKWIITKELCKDDDNMWAYCRSSSKTWSRCIDYWKVWTSNSGYSKDSSVDISTSCGAFNLEDDEEAGCLKVIDHTDIAIDGGGDIWDGMRVFNLVEGRCSNDHPMYHYTTYNDDESVESVYYLHFVFERDNDDIIAKWVISADEMFVVGDAHCIAEDISQCGTNKWNVKQFDGDSVRFILSEDMTVKLNKESDDNHAFKMVNLIWIVPIVLCPIMIVFGMYLMLRKRKTRNNKVVVDDESVEEIEIDIEVEEGDVFADTKYN